MDKEQKERISDLMETYVKAVFPDAKAKTRILDYYVNEFYVEVARGDMIFASAIRWCSKIGFYKKPRELAYGKAMDIVRHLSAEIFEWRRYQL